GTVRDALLLSEPLGSGTPLQFQRVGQLPLPLSGQLPVGDGPKRGQEHDTHSLSGLSSRGRNPASESSSRSTPQNRGAALPLGPGAVEGAVPCRPPGDPPRTGDSLPPVRGGNGRSQSPAAAAPVAVPSVPPHVFPLAFRGAVGAAPAGQPSAGRRVQPGEPDRVGDLPRAPAFPLSLGRRPAGRTRPPGHGVWCADRTGGDPGL